MPGNGPKSFFSCFKGLCLTVALCLATSCLSAAWAGLSCGGSYRRIGQPPLVLQSTEYTCGAACVVSLVKQMSGRSLKESHVAAAIGTNRSIGTTPEKMVSGLGLLGFQARAQEKASLRELKANFRRGKGQILLVQSEGTAHWVVLADMKGGKIKLMDPWKENTGYLTYSEKEFLALWDTNLTGKKMTRFVLVVN